MGLMPIFYVRLRDSMRESVSTLKDQLAAIVTGMGYEFIGCELLRQNRSSLLRIYIDSEKGITVDDCSKVSYQVSAMLDVEDPIQGEYNLEISSPGLNRPLFELKHYQKFIGSKIKVRLSSPIDRQRNFVGILVRANASEICLLIDEKEIVLPFSSIEKANVIADIR